MQVNLPYEIGTVLKAIESGKPHYDRVNHYIVAKDTISVVLELDYNSNSRLSQPITLSFLNTRWKVVKSDNK